MYRTHCAKIEAAFGKKHPGDTQGRECDVLLGVRDSWIVHRIGNHIAGREIPE